MRKLKNKKEEATNSRLGRMEFVGKYEDTSDLLTMPFLLGIDACISVYQENASGQFSRVRMAKNALSELGVPDTEGARRTIFLSFLENMAEDKESEPVLSQMPFGNKIPVLSTSKRELKKVIKKDGYNFCSNRTTAYGASAIFVPGVLEKIGDAIGDFYIVPTSVHEVMILEVDAAPPVAVILNALKEQNQDRNCVEVEDILSDAVFYYDAKSRKVTEI